MYFVVFSLFSLFFSNFFLVNIYILLLLCLVISFILLVNITPNNFYNKTLFTTNYSLINFSFKKFLNYFSFFNFKKFLYLYKSFSFFSLKWQPLFKKSSYYGFYRSMRNQFLNK